MSAASRLKFLYLAYASKPKAERFLYRFIRQSRATRIVECGLTSPLRSRRLIEVAQRYTADGQVSFTGIDVFESAQGQPSSGMPGGRSLIEIFRWLKPSGAALRLLPGSAGGVLAEAANSLPHTDLLLIGHTATDEDLTRAWFYLPRMLHPNSLVLREHPPTEQQEAFFERIPPAQIESLAAQSRRMAA